MIDALACAGGGGRTENNTTPPFFMGLFRAGLLDPHPIFSRFWSGLLLPFYEMKFNGILPGCGVWNFERILRSGHVQKWV